MNLDYESWRCSKVEAFCPPEGCAASMGCARENGWTPETDAAWRALHGRPDELGEG